MDEARFKINSLNRNLIVLANEQTQGRGRRGNKWISPIWKYLLFNWIINEYSK